MRINLRYSLLALGTFTVILSLFGSAFLSRAQSGEAGATGRRSSGPFAPGAEVALVLDDGSHFAAYGVNYLGGTAAQFIWLNRFTPDPSVFPFTLNQIWVLFDNSDGSRNVNIGDAIDLVVYQDADGDPTNGATLLATFHRTVLAIDGTSWSEYLLSPSVYVSGPGDVLIGVVNRYVDDGVSASTYPATCDMTTDQGRSWWGWWSSIPPDPPVLPPDDTFKLKVGNWMIRGYGETSAISITNTPTTTATSTRTPTPTHTLTPTGTKILGDQDAYLPFTVKNWPPTPTPTATPRLAIVEVDNDTGGQLCYEVIGTGIGNKCFPVGVHSYGSFPPGTYQWKASGRCGSASGTKSFSSGEWTHHFWCTSSAGLLERE